MVKKVVLIPMFPTGKGDLPYLIGCPIFGNQYQAPGEPSIALPNQVFLGLVDQPDYWQAVDVEASPVDEIFWRQVVTDGQCNGLLVGSAREPAATDAGTAKAFAEFARTTDGGLTWSIVGKTTDASPPLPAGQSALIVRGMEDGRAGGITAQGGIFLSSADYSSISFVLPGNASAVDVDAAGFTYGPLASIESSSDGQTIMALMTSPADDTETYMSLSTDGGATFSAWTLTTMATYGYPRNLYYRDGTWIMLGARQQYSSDNGGTWTAVTNEQLFDGEPLGAAPFPVVDPGDDAAKFCVLTKNYELVTVSLTAGYVSVGYVPFGQKDFRLQSGETESMKYDSSTGFVLVGAQDEWTQTTTPETIPWDYFDHPPIPARPEQGVYMRTHGYFRTADAVFHASLQPPPEE